MSIYVGTRVRISFRDKSQPDYYGKYVKMDSTGLSFEDIRGVERWIADREIAKIERTTEYMAPLLSFEEWCKLNFDNTNEATYVYPAYEDYYNAYLDDVDRCAMVAVIDEAADEE
jgi:hypothetical protein